MTADLRALAALLLLLVVTGCATGDPAGAGSGYAYAPPERLPHPGIAEGRPVVEVDGVTFYACPPVSAGGPTPLVEDPCLTPADAGYTRYGDYWLMEPSVTCPDGRRATDAGALGVGFVGQPLVSPGGPLPDPATRVDLADCLRAAGR